MRFAEGAPSLKAARAAVSCLKQIASASFEFMGRMIFLERCRLCGSACTTYKQGYRGSTSVCQECWLPLERQQASIDWISIPPGCSLPVVSGACYTGVIKTLIYKFKYDGDRLLAGDLAALTLPAWDLLSCHTDGLPLLMVPVPLHEVKLRKRGFNQAQLLAEEMAARLEIPVCPQALARVRQTRPQYGLSRLERKENISGAFRGEPSRLAGQAVVLIDDICTSGATLAEAASQAMLCGAAAVAAVTVASATFLRQTRYAK